MKKLLELLGIILITSNAAGPLIANKPNNNKDKIKNSLETLTRQKRQAPKKSVNKKDNPTKSSTAQPQNEQPDIIEKEINLDENYSKDIENMLKDFMKNNQIDPLRMINNEGIVTTDYFETETKIKERAANIKIIEKLEKILELKKFDANKIRILVLTLKNKNNKIRLIINLRNFYVLGFINNKNHYFYFDDELVKREKDKNKEKIKELENIKNVLEQLNKLIKEKSKDNTKKENLEWKIKERLNKLKILEKWKEELKKAKTPEEIKKIEENIKNINKIIKEDVNKAKELDKLKKELIEARKEKNKDKVIEINQKIKELNKEILVSIPAVNYNNDKKYLDNKIKNLQGEGLKKDEDEIKSINAKVLEKCSIKEEQKHNLDYTGAYQPQGLNAVNQNIIISQKTLKDAIANLSDYTHGSTRTEEEIQTIKDDLVLVILVTSEAMRFGSYTKYFDHYYEDKDGPAKSSTPNPQTVLPSTSTTDNQVKFKNISEDIQNIINLPESNIYTDTVTVTFELAKNSFAGFKPGFLNQSSKSGNNNSKSKNTTLKKEEKKLSRVITETKLGKISNNSSQTILKHVKELNSNLDINKIKIESITNNSAEISSKYEINWKKYAPQLIGGWIAASKDLEQKRKKIFKKLDCEISYFEVMNKFLNDEKLIEKYNFKFVYTEVEIKKLEEIWKKYGQQIKETNERENEFEKIGLDKLLLKELEKYDKYINNGELEKVLAELNQKKEFKIKIQKKEEKLEQKYLTKVKIIQKIKEDISNEIKLIFDKKTIDKILENEIFEILISKDKFNKIKNVLEELIKKLELDKEKEDYIIKNFILNSKTAILQCDFLITAKNQINYRKINKSFAPNQSFDFFSKENSNKIIDKNFLISVVSSGNIDILKLILSKNVNVNIKNEIGLSPLNGAIYDDNLEIVKLLLANGANPNLVNKNGYTSLFFAAERDCSLEIVEELINNGADVNAQDTNSDTPLHIAIRNDHEAITKLLIENYADVNKLGFSNQTPLSIATFQSNNIEIVKHLLNHPQIDVNISDFAVLELFSLNNPELTQILKQKLNSKCIKKTEEEIKEKVQKYEKTKKQIQDKFKNLPSPVNEVINKFISNPDLLNFIIQNQDMFNDMNQKFSTKITKTSFKQNQKDKSGFGGLKRGFLNSSPKSNSNINTNSGGSQSQGISSKRVSVGEQAGTSGTQNKNTKTTNQNNLYDVPADGSCLFWSVATAYLLPVRNNNEEFRNRFIQLFGEENLKYILHIQKLLQQYDLEDNRNLNQLWYQDQTANNLVINFFRNRVVDYIQSHLDTISNRNGQLTFRNLIQDNNDIDINYLEIMRQSSTWGGTPEIIAMSNLLNANISVNNNGSYQPVNQNSNNNNIAISYVELEKGSGIQNHYNFSLTSEEDRTNYAVAINYNQGNVPVVDITKRPDNLLPITPKPEANAIQLAVDDHGQRHATLANNNEDDDANQGNNIAKAPKPTVTPLQKDEYHFVDKKAEDDSLKNDENLEINLIKNNKDEIKQNAPVVNQPINTNMENLQTTTAKAINQYNALSKEEKLKRLNEINRYYQTLPENDKKAFKEKLTNTGLAALSGGALTAYGTKMTVSGTAATSVTNAEAMEMTPFLSTSTTESLAAAETITVAETAAVEGGVIAGETGTAAALAPETLGLSLVIGGLAIAGTWMYFAFHHHSTSDIALPASIHHNVYDNIEKWYKFLAHDKLKIKINKNTWNEIKQNKNSQANITKIIKNKFVISDHSGWGGSVTNEDFNTLVKVILLHFEQINGYFEILDNENDGFVIITNTEGDWLGIE